MKNTARLQAERVRGRRTERALRALVTNYLHELSERHGGAGRGRLVATEAGPAGWRMTAGDESARETI